VKSGRNNRLGRQTHLDLRRKKRPKRGHALDLHGEPERGSGALPESSIVGRERAVVQ